MKRLLFVLAVVMALPACGDALLSSTSEDGDPNDRRAGDRRREALPRPSSADSLEEGAGDRFVILLDPDAAKSGTSVEGLASEHGVTMERTYRAVLQGGAARLTSEQARRLRRDARVERVVPDELVWAMGVQAGSSGVQANPPWGLDRIDQRQGLDSTYAYSRMASEVDVYVIDTGIYAEHQDFGGRISGGVDFVDGSGGDCNGHGTHVAGTVGGATYGVAKGVRLVPLRVLGCDGSGYTSDIIAALDWVALNADGPSVVNMSLGSDYYAPVNEAVRTVTSAGIPVVVAAGNDAQNACNYSPASEPAAITVAAANKNDAYAYFSNYGDCVDLFAPGVDVTSAYIGSPTATAALQGTSMASPHVAGVAALLLAGQPYLAAGEVHELITEEATQDAVYDPLTANSHMLFSLMSGAALEIEASRYWKYRSVELVWTGLEGETVQVYRDGEPLGATPNDGKTSITMGWEASGTHRFKVCMLDASLCTPEESVTL